MHMQVYCLPPEMAAIIGILTVLATVTADSSATSNHAIGLRSGAIDYIKVYTDLKKTNTKGCATRAGASFRCDGHRFAFGNSEDKVRVECLGRKQRGRVGDPPFNHNTGKGYIEGVKGYYHDALVNKKNKVNVLLHNTFGGFSPPAASKIRRMGTTAKGGTDRTRYADRRRLSYVTHHTRRIATAIIKNDAYAINAQARHLKTVLYDHRLGDGHEHSRADDAAF